MPKRALYEKRPWLLASIAVALAFYYLRAGPMPELYLLPLKGAAVGLLAIYAFMRHSSADARLLVWVMAFGALGDMVLMIDMEVAGWLFFGGHLLAMALYLRHRPAHLTRSRKIVAVALLLVTPLMCWLLPADRGVASSFGLYGLAMGGMAAAAWASDFPRYRVGAGAVLFVISHCLWIAGMGPLSGSMAQDIFVWPVYYLGQFLICTGVIQTLRKRRPELRVVH
ncbi:lysoplasmalogenase [Altericroceibacterium spongiae]|uniref:Lysoplasmalogenase n=1 Tax=Altericroceibacterium spongiae TaxID=2320269 RepID=A0A420ES76_9SPHN|nr:lysoplasmalogenase family protein [Altericroceibacterium spongiae]RKF23521.1 lysoplasmalogenase [Altericroceibacterium spongiae]